MTEPVQQQPVINLTGITKIYRIGSDRIAALDSLDLTIKANEYVAVMGRSGSGKSTLMNILGCLDRPTSGIYQLDNRDTTRMSQASLASIRNSRIGFVFQSFELMSRLTALKNVEMPLIYSKTAIWHRKKLAVEALEKVGLKDRMHHRPNQLSGGEKQRVAIARALICKPTIILADEPTGNLDTKTSDQILGLFQTLHHQGQTILMVTHEPDVAQVAQRIITMQDGRVISDVLNDHPSNKDIASGEK